MWLQPELLNVRQRNIIKQMTGIKKKTEEFFYTGSKIYTNLSVTRGEYAKIHLSGWWSQKQASIFTHDIYISRDKEFKTHQNEIHCSFINGLNFFRIFMKPVDRENRDILGNVL